MQPGDDLAALIIEAAKAAGLSLIAGDILVMAQKIVSKAEGRLVRLADVTPGEEAVRLAQETGKDAARGGRRFWTTARRSSAHAQEF